MNRSADGHGARIFVDGDGVEMPQVDLNSMIKCGERSGIAVSAAGAEEGNVVIGGIADLLVKTSAGLL